MISSKRSSALLIVPASLLVLSGCALIEPADTSEAPTAMQACALGHTWELDTTDLSEKLLAKLPASGVPATAVEPSGGQTLTWSEKGAVTIDSDMAFTITATPAADQIMTITQAYNGTVAGKALINVDVAIPRDWDVSNYAIETSAVLNDVAVEEVPYTIPLSDFDDKLGLIITCEADVLTVNPRGTDFIQRWTKAS